MKFLNAIRMLLSLGCDEAAQLLSRRLDDELSTVERWALAVHLAICRPCKRFNRFLGHLRGVIRRAIASDGEIPLQAGLDEPTRRRLAAVIREKKG